MSDPIMDSPSPAINIERSFFWGQIFMAGLYSIDVFMYFYSTHLFIISTNTARRTTRLYIAFGGLILALTTVTVFTDAVLLEFMWIDHRDFPGGPLSYLAATTSAWWQVLGTATGQVTNFCGDALLLYRCYVIYNGRWSIIIFPIILYLGSFAMAMVMLVQSAIPGSPFFRGVTVNFGVPWAALSVALNFTVTALITFRILKARHSAKKHFADRISSIDVYTSLVAILVESSLPFTVLGLIFAVTYGKNVDEGPAFLLVWSAFSALSPQFIIFRVASGHAWTRNVASDVSGRISTFKTKDCTNPSYKMSTIVTSTVDPVPDFKGNRSIGSFTNDHDIPSHAGASSTDLKTGPITRI